MDKKADITCIFCGVRNVYHFSKEVKTKYKDTTIEYISNMYLCKNCGETFSDLSMIKDDLNKIKKAYKKALSGKA